MTPATVPQLKQSSHPPKSPPTIHLTSSKTTISRRRRAEKSTCRCELQGFVCDGPMRSGTGINGAGNLPLINKYLYSAHPVLQEKTPVCILNTGWHTPTHTAHRLNIQCDGEETTSAFTAVNVQISGIKESLFPFTCFNHHRRDDDLWPHL